MKPTFSRKIFGKYSETNFVKIRSVGVEFFHADGGSDGRADGLTDMTKLTGTFRNFENVPKEPMK